MGLIDTILASVGGAARLIPSFKGAGRIFRASNKLFLLLGAKPTVEAAMRDGTTMILDLRSGTEENAFYTGRYDNELISILKGLLDPELIFVDVGANIGFYSVAIANYLEGLQSRGKVIAFEPFPDNFNRIGANIGLNKLTQRCTVHNFGLSDHNGSTKITLREDFQRGSSTGNASIMTNADFDAGFETVTIDLATLDDYWRDQNFLSRKIGLIKMDIEGHEDFCLRGATKVLAQHRPTIMMEINKPYYTARQVDLDAIFVPTMPKEYSIFCKIKKLWQEIKSFDNCADIDNVFLVPQERLTQIGYEIFERISTDQK